MHHWEKRSIRGGFGKKKKEFREGPTPERGIGERTKHALNVDAAARLAADPAYAAWWHREGCSATWAEGAQDILEVRVVIAQEGTQRGSTVDWMSMHR